jgi:3-hydroxybutyryl-CoA dehydrogenase
MRSTPEDPSGGTPVCVETFAQAAAEIKKTASAIGEHARDIGDMGGHILQTVPQFLRGRARARTDASLRCHHLIGKGYLFMAEIKRVGVCGCGLMGSGIAQVAATAGYDVIVFEAVEAALTRGMAAIKKSLDKFVERGKSGDGRAFSAADRDAALARLKTTVAIGDLKDCDLVIEAVVENMAVKQELFAKLDGLLAPHAIICSNTSSLCVIEMASVTKRMPRVAGLHFFNPVPLMKLVEIVKTIVTSQETIDTLYAFAAKLGKTAVLAQDTPGFIVNRLLVPYLLYAIRMFEAGLASREDIDEGMKLGCGHPMGPLTLLDFVGLDTTYFISEIMFDEFKDPLMAPPPLLKRMVLAGHLGRKSGRGFYDYSGESPK